MAHRLHKQVSMRRLIALTLATIAMLAATIAAADSASPPLQDAMFWAAIGIDP